MSIISDPEHKCYICLFSSDKKHNICACISETAFAHDECLRQWIYTSNAKTCKICKSNYNLTMGDNMYTVVRTTIYKIFCVIKELIEYNVYFGDRWENQL